MPGKVREMSTDENNSKTCERGFLNPRRKAWTLRLGLCFCLAGSFAGCGQNDANLSGDELTEIEEIETDADVKPLPASPVKESVEEPPSRLAKYETEPAPVLKTLPVGQAGNSSPHPASDPAEGIFTRLIEARRDSNPADWEQAEQELEKLGKSAVPVLVKSLQSSDVEVRELATMWLVRLGPEAENIERELAAVLDDESDFVRVNAASALSHLPAYADRVIPILTQLLTHPEFSVKITAATALGNAGDLATSAVPALVESLRGEEDLQLAVLSTLGRIGPAAEAALPAIAELWQAPPSETVKVAAEEAYRTIQGAAN